MSSGRILVDLPMIREALQAQTDAMNEEKAALDEMFSQLIFQANELSPFGLNPAVQCYVDNLNQLKRMMNGSCHDIEAAMDDLRKLIHEAACDSLWIYPPTEPLPEIYFI